VLILASCNSNNGQKASPAGIANSAALQAASNSNTMTLEEYASATDTEEAADDAMDEEMDGDGYTRSYYDNSKKTQQYDEKQKQYRKKNRKKTKKYKNKNYNKNYDNRKYKSSKNNSRNNYDNTDSRTESSNNNRNKQYLENVTDDYQVMFNSLMPNNKKSVQSKVLRRKGYVTSYNGNTKLPNWTMWYLTKSHTYGSSQRSSAKFHEDFEVPAPRADNNDYYNSRYDRGHMCPAGDNKWDPTAMNDCFLFTNMCPQNHNLNTGAWNDLEITCRAWARRYGLIYIVCGPLLSNGSHKTVGPHKVVVPEKFYKVVLRLGDKPAALGFIYDNQSAKRGIEHYVVSVDEVERLTGLDFFPGLIDRIENTVEAKASLDDWFIPEID